MRVSFAFNDFFGGFDKPAEIILQAITSEKNTSNPEEIAHVPIFNLIPSLRNIINADMQHSALRIEKNGNHYRLLFATGQAENFAFKEAVSKDLSIQPKYIGIFSLKGFVNDSTIIPAHFSFFSLDKIDCNQ